MPSFSAAMDQPVPDPIRRWKMLPLYGSHEHRLDGLFVVGIIRVAIHKAFPLVILQPEPAACHTDPFGRPFGNQFLGLLDKI